MEEENKTQETQRTYSSEEKTKKCKHCQSDISMKAKICPVCKKKQKPNGCLTAILVVVGLFVVIVVVGSIVDEGDTVTKTTNTTTESTNVKTEETTDAKTEVATPIEYTACDASALIDDLTSNALKAEKQYNGQYIELTGKLSNIDSSGDYISLTSQTDDFSLVNIQCFIKNEDQTNRVIEMSVGDTVTLKGKVTDVGEIMGYSLDIDEIE